MSQTKDAQVSDDLGSGTSDPWQNDDEIKPGSPDPDVKMRNNEQSGHLAATKFDFSGLPNTVDKLEATLELEKESASNKFLIYECFITLDGTASIESQTVHRDVPINGHNALVFEKYKNGSDWTKAQLEQDGFGVVLKVERDDTSDSPSQTDAVVQQKLTYKKCTVKAVY